VESAIFDKRSLPKGEKIMNMKPPAKPVAPVKAPEPKKPQAPQPTSKPKGK
jgi:hypothetical protein